MALLVFGHNIFGRMKDSWLLSIFPQSNFKMRDQNLVVHEDWDFLSEAKCKFDS